MKVKFISTTNKLAECIVGQDVELSYFITASFNFDPEGLGFEYRRGYWKTSIIKKIEINEISLNCYDIVISTNNSKYVFREGVFSDKKVLTEKEKEMLAMHFL